MFIKKNIFPEVKAQYVKEHKLTYLFWECTLRCNLNCRHCGSDCHSDSKVADMPYTDFIKVLDVLKASGCNSLMVCITGGEPLLRSDLEDAGKEIMKRGYNWGIVTNAMLFTPERFVSLVNSGLGSITFSLDGFETEHTYLRKNESSFEKTVSAIKTVVQFQNKFPNRVIFDVVTCVHQKNIARLEEFREFLISLGVKHWRIFTIFPEGRAKENELSLDSKDYKKLMDFIQKSRKMIHVNYICEGFLGKYEFKVRDDHFFCRSGINVASVFNDGSIGGCLSVRSPAFIQGNIYRDNFIEVWNNRFNNMRNRSWAKLGKCKNCRNWEKCEGNGLHLHADDKSECVYCNLDLLKAR